MCNVKTEEIISKLKYVLNIRKDKDIAELLEMSPTSLSSAIKHGRDISDKVIPLSIEYGISLDWLFPKKNIVQK